MADTDLEKMLDAVINDNAEEAQKYFHDFVAKKTKDIIQGTSGSLENDQTTDQ